MVVNDIADCEIGRTVPVGYPDLANFGMHTREDGDRIGWFAEAQPPILKAFDEHRDEDVANAHSRVDGPFGRA